MGELRAGIHAGIDDAEPLAHYDGPPTGESLDIVNRLSG